MNYELPQSKSKGVIYKIDGTTEIIDGPFSAKKIREVIGCNIFQMVPCTMGKLKGKFEIWINEKGQLENELNERASKILGEQVFGNNLYGNVMIVKCGTIE